MTFPLPAPDAYGPGLGGHTVRQAMEAVLQAWTPTYIAEVASRLGLSMSPFQQWVALPEYRALPQNYTAACWTSVTGTRGQPQRQGDGTWRAVYTAETSTLVYGADWDATEDLCSAYNLAVRMCLLQHRSLGQVAEDTAWLGESYTPVTHSNTRTLGVYRGLWAVTLAGTVQDSAGPGPIPAPAGGGVLTPPLQPNPTVATETITVEEPL